MTSNIRSSKDGTCISTDGTCQKYIIKKNGKRYNSKTFDNYEQARSYVRKKLRSDPSVSCKYFDQGWRCHNNPSITDYGFSVAKV